MSWQSVSETLFYWTVGVFSGLLCYTCIEYLMRHFRAKARASRYERDCFIDSRRGSLSRDEWLSGIGATELSSMEGLIYCWERWGDRLNTGALPDIAGFTPPVVNPLDNLTQAELGKTLAYAEAASELSENLRDIVRGMDPFILRAEVGARLEKLPDTTMWDYL